MHITVKETGEITPISARRVRARLWGINLQAKARDIVEHLHDTRLLLAEDIDHLTQVAEELQPKTIEHWVKLLDRHAGWWQEQEEEEQEQEEVKLYRWEPSKWTLDEEEEEEEQQTVKVYRADWWR